MGSIDTQSIKFHFDRGDFLKWSRTTIGDEELTRIINKLDKKNPEENLREKLVDKVKKKNFRIAVNALNYLGCFGMIVWR